MMPNWSDITYLQTGTPRQRMAYPVVKRVMAELSEFTPFLAGTIPIDIDLPESDLDVICYADDLNRFFFVVEQQFSGLNGFTIKQYAMGTDECVVANLILDDFLIEIFGQSHPVTEQNAYRHMVVEARLLHLGGELMKQTIRQLKHSGLKTEPAFAQYLRLSGDPYQALLDLYDLNDQELLRIFKI